MAKKETYPCPKNRKLLKIKWNRNFFSVAWEDVGEACIVSGLKVELPSNCLSIREEDHVHWSTKGVGVLV